jgi:hypothetical protein
MTSLDLGWFRTATQHGCDVADYLDRRSMVIGPNGDGDLALAPIDQEQRAVRLPGGRLQLFR